MTNERAPVTFSERIEARVRQRVEREVERLEGETDDAYRERTHARRRELEDALADRLCGAFMPDPEPNELRRTVQQSEGARSDADPPRP